MNTFFTRAKTKRYHVKKAQKCTREFGMENDVYISAVFVKYTLFCFHSPKDSIDQNLMIVVHNKMRMADFLDLKKLY